ncbi:hypothetical protein E0493_12140 [Roseomonas sp. M0104]|uniref:Uncharacterized protein n=1 Tax=Teichococcus coralli TaxID=2545983 RepID=A0A845BDG9_9PROT|nr:hypothetical protein [Pseudoroseomonas coralli]MXP64094.1 hypothetical protein [Pseudoroseomonas coralli]
MPFPEVAEAEAGGEVARIYAELRATAGIPVVNLIWRHFAALPGVLPWAWAAVRPVAGSALLAEGTARLEAAALRAGGGGVAALPVLPEEARAVVEIYNRGNCTNLQLLTALRRILAGEAAGGGEAPEAAPAPPPLPPTPPMPQLERLAPAVRAQVRELAALHGPAVAEAVPSLYRHLALWPDLLPPLHATCAALMADGTLPQGRDALLAEARALSGRMLPALRPPPDFPAAQRGAVLAALDTFAGQLIAEMAVLGLLLRAASRRG